MHSEATSVVGLHLLCIGAHSAQGVAGIREILLLLKVATTVPLGRHFDAAPSVLRCSQSFRPQKATLYENLTLWKARVVPVKCSEV